MDYIHTKLGVLKRDLFSLSCLSFKGITSFKYLIFCLLNLSSTFGIPGYHTGNSSISACNVISDDCI